MNRFVRDSILTVGAALALRALIRKRRRIDLRGASVVITGGSRGLGLNIARVLVGQGARLALLARSTDDLERAERELAAAGGDVLILPCDVTVRPELEAALAWIADKRGRIDVLINNAGVIQVGPMDQMGLLDFDEAVRTHFWAPLNAMRAVIPGMRKQGGGRIVNISSIGGKVAVPHLGPYAASKFALTGLSNAMRAELARDGILITTVCPGLMRTGSHLNIEVKGNHEAEFAWFAMGAGAPLITVSAEHAAKQVVRALRDGDHELVIGAAAKLLVLADAIAPELVADVMSVVARAMPKASPEGDEIRTGWESRSRWAPSPLTRRADREVERHNELGAHSADELTYRRAASIVSRK